jgi:hypothetical protein
MQTEIKDAIESAISSLRRTKEFEPEMYGRIYPTLADLIYAVRCDRDEARAELAKTVSAPVAAGPASWQEFYDMLSMAARVRMQFGASDAQVRLLATLAVQQGLMLRQMEMSTLSKNEASAMISSMKGQ